jgi:hypothetical protein
MRLPLACLLIALSGTVSAADWQPLGAGITHNGAPCDTLLVSFGGWRASPGAVQHWADQLADTTRDEPARRYAIAGPQDTNYAGREIDTAALAADLARELALPGCTGATLIAHSSGAFVAHRTLQQLAALPGGADALAKIGYLMLDGDSGSGELELTRALAWQIGAVTTVSARQGSLESPNAKKMRALATQLPNTQHIVLDALGSPCDDAWCVHELPISRAPAKRAGFDLERDYQGATLEYRYLNRLDFAPRERPHAAFDYRVLEPFADSRVHVMRVDLRAPGLRLTLTSSPERGLRLNEFSGAAEAVAAINASFFDKTFAPVGHTVSSSEVWPDAYALSEAVFACTADLRCALHPAPPEAPRPEWWLAAGVIPPLLSGGSDASVTGCERRPKFCTDAHPRTAIGLGDGGDTLWLVVAEGRRPPVHGLSIAQLREVFERLGASEAANLDGGGSSAMSLFGQQRVARPFNEPEMRRIANALILRFVSDQ